MPIVHRDLKPSLVLSIALLASCLPESPEPEINATAQASTIDTAVLPEQDVPLSAAEQDAADTREVALLDAFLEYQSNSPDVSVGGHCNVGLFQCDPYPIGKGNHKRADAFCSSVCLDTIAHCKDYSTAEIEFCCGHPDQDYRDTSGVVHHDKHCMPSGEPNWATRCAPGLNP